MYPEKWRMLENKNKQDVGHITGGRYFEICTVYLRWYGHVKRMKNQRLPENLQQLQWKEQEKEEDHVKDEELSSR
jgi:hypothetical protein